MEMNTIHGCHGADLDFYDDGDFGQVQPSEEVLNMGFEFVSLDPGGGLQYENYNRWFLLVDNPDDDIDAIIPKGTTHLHLLTITGGVESFVYNCSPLFTVNVAPTTFTCDNCFASNPHDPWVQLPLTDPNFEPFDFQNEYFDFSGPYQSHIVDINPIQGGGYYTGPSTPPYMPFPDN